MDNKTLSAGQLRYRSFVEDIISDLKLFVFILIVLSLFRVLFIWLFRYTLDDGTTFFTLLKTMWFGFRLSLKTAAACLIPTFILGTLGRQVYLKWPSFKIRLVVGSIELMVFSLLFQCRIPYYKEFHNAFDPFIFNTFHDDIIAIAATANSQYNAVWRVLGGLLIGVLLIYIFKKFLPVRVLPFDFPKRFRFKWQLLVAIIIIIPCFAYFMRYGGGLSYNSSIYWKNSARMGQHLLNEAILDDVQALYKASRIHKSLSKIQHANLSWQDIEAAAKGLTGKIYTQENFDASMLKTAKGATIKKPRHIFLIIGETYMLWPMMPDYEYLHISDGMKALADAKNGIIIDNFIPAGNGTMFGLTSIVLGLPELNVFTANQLSARNTYITALPDQLKKLGYETRFFYGGFASWENVGIFMPAQGFDKSYYRDNFDASPGNAWGVEDKYFLEGIKNLFKDDKPSFNLILTSSNHPPLTVDLDKEPQVKSAADFKAILPPNLAADKDLIPKLRTFEYSDKYISEFIKEMSVKYPDSIFIFTGDHAQRWYAKATPTEFETIAVPFIMYGLDINKKMLPQNASGGHMDIAATVIELIAPKGFEYYSLGDNMFKGNVLGLHNSYWVKGGFMGMTGSNDVYFRLPGTTGDMPTEELADTNNKAKDIQKMAWWQIFKVKTK